MLPGQQLNVLYLFSGKPRKADIRHYLQAFANSQNFSLNIREVDIERSPDDDLTNSGLWDEIFTLIRSGAFQVIILSPPCGTWSRARCQWQQSPGPRPVRNKQHPWGFPWLSDRQFLEVKLANMFVLKSIELANLISELGGFYLFEHPEDLGDVADQSPASKWQLEEMQKLQVTTRGVTWAIFQCAFGASSSKPTRFLSNLPACRSVSRAVWPIFDKYRTYRGPLPPKCPHTFHVRKLIGKDKSGKWATSASAAYSPGLCKYLASFITSVLRKGDTCDEPQSGPQVSAVFQNEIQGANEDDKQTLTDSSQETVMETRGVPEDVQNVPTTDMNVDPKHEDEKFVGKENWGKPVNAEWAGEEREIVDGFGLCSPNRWKPESRGWGLGVEARQLAESLHELTERYVDEHIGDQRRSAFELVTGKIRESPFGEKVLQRFRSEWANLLPMPGSAVVRADGQPFYLDLMAQTLEALGDPDASILVNDEDSFSTGVPVGYKEVLPRVPSVFPPKVKQNKLDDSVYNEMAVNYRSAEENSEGLLKKFREDEEKGLMFPTTVGALRSQHPGATILVAALGAIVKPDQSVRPLHDGTHFVQLNNEITIQDQLQYPGPHDATAAIREARETGEAVFTVSGNISAAHRRVKVRKKDWPLLCCRVDSDSKVIWVNRVGTFGVSSAPYWWTRLFALVGRLVSRILLRRWILKLVYVDDIHMVAVGEQKFRTLWMALFLYEALGTPFAFHKFAGGLQVEFVGYYLDYDSKRIGITVKRGDWILAFLDDFKRSNYTVSMRRFAEFLGRLGFVSRVLLWLRPHLSPLYSWSAAMDKGVVATAPKLVRLVCMYLREQFSDRRYMYSVERPIHRTGDAFRTDAKCEQDLVVLGGYECSSRRWFSIRVTQEEAPWLFKEDGSTQWASSPAELLSVFAALQCFGYLDPSVNRGTMEVWLEAGTDNISNEHLMRKTSTTRWPLTLVNMQLSDRLMAAGLRLTLRWRPRDENELADRLTNGIFTDFDPKLRVACTLADLDMKLLKKLWESRGDFLDRESWKFYHGGKFEKSQWGL